ncbi:hypothetical protein Tco_0481600 [Tanacetum coccineum]
MLPRLESETLLTPMEAIDTRNGVTQASRDIVPLYNEYMPTSHYGFADADGQSGVYTSVTSKRQYVKEDFVLTWKAVKEEKDGSEGSLEWAKKAKT